MKKIALLILPLFLFAAQADMNKKILSLEKEIQTLKEQVNQNSQNIDEDAAILEKVETKSILDKLNFSPELLLRFDKFYYNNESIEGETTPFPNDPTLLRRTDYTKNFDIATSVRFRLNMNLELEDLKFHGRMLYSNSTQSNQRICILSRDIKSGISGSAFDIDRAYVDYTPNKASSTPFTLSFGLLPTSGGTPMQYAQNKKRGSLFPALVFDMNTYGVIGTQKIGENTFTRLVLAKPYTLRPQFYPYQCNRENIENANIVGLYADTKLNFLGNSLLSFGVNMMHDLKATPYLGPDITSTQNSIVLGTLLTYGLGVDIEHVADSDLTLFTHVALTTPYGNGKIVDYTQDSNGQAYGDYAKGEMLTDNSYSVYVGAKYDISKEFNIGAEYNYGSKYWFSGTQGAEDMYNKLALRGCAYELYGIWQFHKNLNAKIGFLQMHEHYTGSGWHFGTPVKKEATQDIGYFSLEARF